MWFGGTRRCSPRGLPNMGKFCGAGAVPRLLSVLVCGHRLRQHRHRRAGAGRDHVDCLRESFHRNLYKEFLSPDCTEAQEATMAKIVSLIVKVGAVVFILALPRDYAIQLQLLGGIWIIQLLPAILLGLYTRWCGAQALLVGWVAGLAVGTYMAAVQGFTTSVYPLSAFGITIPGYAALYSVIVNFVLAIAATPLFNRRLQLGST